MSRFAERRRLGDRIRVSALALALVLIAAPLAGQVAEFERIWSHDTGG